jgi:drug/metabolite transporter (DMT)-like permease
LWLACEPGAQPSDPVALAASENAPFLSYRRSRYHARFHDQPNGSFVKEQLHAAPLPSRMFAWSILLVMGAAWGLSFSFARLATTGGAHPLGALLWECWIAALMLVVFLVWRRIAAPLSPRLVRLHVLTSVVGVIVPGTAFFYASAHLPASILSITVGTVPAITFIASALLGVERFEIVRLFGVALATLAIVFLVAPEDSLSGSEQVPWMLLGLLAAASYASLSLVLTVLAPRGANAPMLTCGMFVVSSLLIVPIVMATDSFVAFGWPWGRTEWALVGLGVVNGVAYPLYFVLVERAGPIFSSFTANLVTLFGVLWGIVLFSERNSVWVWLSFATIMLALTLVSPRARANGYPG